MDAGKTGKLLRSFGKGRDYRGFDYCSCGVELAMEEPDSLRSVTKNIYPEVAKRYKTNTGCVERDIRTVAEMVWRSGGREFFYKALGVYWEKRPSNEKFLKLLLEYVLSDRPIPSGRKANPCLDCEIVKAYEERIKRLGEEKLSLEKENKMLKDTLQACDIEWQDT